MRPWGHLGLIFTFGLPWSLLAFACGSELGDRCYLFGWLFPVSGADDLVVGVYGLKQLVCGQNGLIPMSGMPSRF